MQEKLFDLFALPGSGVQTLWAPGCERSRFLSKHFYELNKKKSHLTLGIHFLKYTHKMHHSKHGVYVRSKCDGELKHHFVVCPGM